jgi:hypothetical protein
MTKGMIQWELDMSAVEHVRGAPADAGLRRNALGMPGLLVQSVANMAPAAAMTLLPPARE